MIIDGLIHKWAIIYIELMLREVAWDQLQTWSVIGIENNDLNF